MPWLTKTDLRAATGVRRYSTGGIYCAVDWRSPRALLCFYPPAGRAASGGRVPIVATTHGKLRGQVRHGLAEYKGIHYGASTGGANRFLGPQPVRAWSGVRDAVRLGL